MLKRLLLGFVLLALCGACRTAPEPEVASVAGVYFWRTTLNITEKERAWMDDHQVETLYLRLFDIVVADEAPVHPSPSPENPSPSSKAPSPSAQPNATLRFEQPLPTDVAIVPTVFIVADVFRHSTDVDTLAAQTARRIARMAETNGFEYAEVQIDCDWTTTTREPFFRFLGSLRSILAPDVRLSATIRLHQLSQPAPPVDSGVLMVYNTGDFRTASSAESHNPILDWRDVEPYAPRLADYPLPLTAAYPNFRWQLLFAADEFKGILYGVDLTDASLFAPAADGSYRVVQRRDIAMSMGGSTLRLIPGETVRVWRVADDELARVQQRLERLRPGLNARAVVYCLDEANF